MLKEENKIWQSEKMFMDSRRKRREYGRKRTERERRGKTKKC